MRREAAGLGVCLLTMGSILWAVSAAAGTPVELVLDDGELVEARGRLVDGQGMSLYLFLPDGEGHSTCYEQCADNWPPLLAQDGITLGEGVAEELLGTTLRDDGTVQVTYGGWPLYYFAGDEGPGNVNGQGAGDVWYAVSADGDALVAEDSVEEQAEHAAREAAKTSTLEGVFTEEQATRGQEVYSQRCIACHGEGLGGVGFAPALSGLTFDLTWKGETVGKLFDVTRRTMPEDDPGGLDRQEYADIIAFILQANGFPAGEEELLPEVEILHEITIETD